MDASRFDALARSLGAAGSRRGLLGLFASLPLVGELAAVLDTDGGEAKGRRKRRQQADHARDLNAEKKRKKRKKCKSHAQICAGTCGTVTYKCRKKKKTADCGSCACDPPCDECFLCNAATGVCEPDPAQQGDACGSPGQVCQVDGACACDATSCSNPTPLCVGGTCTACGAASACQAAGLGDLCCGGACVSGVCCAAAACAPTGDDCVSNQCQCGGGPVCAGAPELCCAGACTDTDTDPDHCGQCGQPCAGTSPVCWDGGCVCGDVCPSGCQFSAVQDAITTLPAGSTIRICAGTYGAIVVNKNLTLIGAGDGSDPASNTILDAADSGKVVVIAVGRTVSLEGLRITGGLVDFAAGIDNDGNLTMTGCTVTENATNTANGGGGIINRVSSSLQMTDCTVTLNESAGSAGGIGNFGSITMTNCSVSDNNAAGTGSGGGLVNVSGATATLNGSSVTGNTSGLAPAGIRNDSGGTVNLNAGSTVSGNSPGNCGGSGTFNGTGCA